VYFITIISFSFSFLLLLLLLPSLFCFVKIKQKQKKRVSQHHSRNPLIVFNLSMSEFAGIRITWNRVIAAAKDLPDPALTHQEEIAFDEREQTIRERHLMFSLENVFIIMSRGNQFQ
jgi:hypothetical protein